MRSLPLGKTRDDISKGLEHSRDIAQGRRAHRRAICEPPRRPGENRPIEARGLPEGLSQQILMLSLAGGRA